MQPQHTEHDPSTSSFAGLLSAIAAAKALPSNSFADDLENDVATLTYDRALQNHARYKSNAPASFPATQVAKPSVRPARTPQSENKHDQKRKNASVTIRMSQEEFAQLQLRSAETNLTVSAYLRSCTFEAESLRAQVKQALAELRNTPATAPQSESAVPKWLRLIRR